MTVIDSPTKIGGELVMLEGRMSITDVARELGVTTKTITRWEKAGKIKQAKRDWRGWRVYSSEELQQMKSFVQTVY
jgi:predicted site-specific integrase-resolvase